MSEIEVVKSNHVVEASYRLSLSEQRLVLLCIQKIKKGQKITAETPFDVTASEFADMFSVTIDRAYVALQDVADKLYERSITIHQPDQDNPKLTKTTTRWITTKDYYDKEGKIRIYFSHKVIKYISLLEGNFTRYNLEYVAGMSSIYGIRFYELMKSWLFGEPKKIKRVAIDELKELLDLKDEKGSYQYPSIKDFKLRVLDKAMSDINNHSDLQANYEDKKTGRKITHFDFTFSLKVKDSTADTDKKEPETKTAAKVLKPKTIKQEETQDNEKSRVLNDFQAMQNMAKMAGQPLADVAHPIQMENYRKYKLI